jgi:CubicO group peptidase (beta-lactamase class C family)
MTTAPTRSIETVFPRAAAVLDRGRERGFHTGAQLFVALDGETVIDAGWGEARPGVAMTADTLAPWLSAGKPLTAALVLKYCERGLLALGEPVARYVPEFSAAGKGSVTLEQLLTHSSGLTEVDIGWPSAPWSEQVARVCAAVWGGTAQNNHAAYSRQAAWLILGEVLARVGGRPFNELIRAELFEPLGMSFTWNGMPDALYDNNAANIGWLFERTRKSLVPTSRHERAWITSPSPGAGSLGPIRELAAFYRCLLADGRWNGTTILSPRSVDLMISRQRKGLFDDTFGHIVDFGLGVIVDSNRYGADTMPYGFGRYCSPSTFGHGGSQSLMALADPEHRLVVAYFANGRPGEPQHQRRNRALIEAIYTDLGLAAG